LFLLLSGLKLELANRLNVSDPQNCKLASSFCIVLQYSSNVFWNCSAFLWTNCFPHHHRRIHSTNNVPLCYRSMIIIEWSQLILQWKKMLYTICVQNIKPVNNGRVDSFIVDVTDSCTGLDVFASFIGLLHRTTETVTQIICS